MKVIFLDVDGVLIHENYKSYSTYSIDPDKVKLLSDIVKETDSKIVLISNWRVYNTDEDKETYDILNAELEKCNISIYEDAPFIKPEIISYEEDEKTGLYKNVKYNPFTTRGGEILSYLKSHDDIENFIIIDDDNVDYDYFRFDDNFIQTNRYDGLTEEDVEKSIEKLNNPKKTR